MTSTKIKTMTAGEAYIEACRRNNEVASFGADGDYFVLVGWKNPDCTSLTGPILITVSGDTVIEIDRKGRFVNAFPTSAEYYFPYFELDEDENA